MFVRTSLALALCLTAGIAGCAADASNDDVDSQSDEVRRNDLARDLAQRGGWRGTPFRGQQERTVHASLARELKVLAERCIQYRETPTVLLETRNLCPREIRDFFCNNTETTEKA